jgi:hypothetical protein
MLHHIATISVCYGGQFESKMTAKIQKSSDLGNFQASKPFIHMPYNISIKFPQIPSTLNFSRFLVATAAILKFLSLKIMCTHAAPYCDHFGLLCRQFESKMTAKIQKSSDLGEIW